jgi:hypothetical protein
MKLALVVIVSVSSLAFAVNASAQSTSAPTQSAPVQPNSTAAVPVPVGKRMACQAASQAAAGQERRDQMQLCMAQAHLDCLKQAIDQKIVGAQRKDFMKSCSN